MVRKIVGPANYIEIYINTPIEECERRDVKGLYAKARSGKITNFTGITSSFEPPKSPDIILDTTNISILEATKKIYNQLIIKIK
jgi:adenylylsulfate kinase-like enzyme